MRFAEAKAVQRKLNERLTFLDVTRGIAALAVVLDHSSELLWPEARDASHYIFNAGKFGVVLFFLTSGFVIPYSLERGNSIIRFIVSRIFRLYPAYLVSVVAFAALFMLGLRDAIEPNAIEHFSRNAVINLTMLQEFVRIPDLRGHYYTLALEIIFYLLCGILFVRNLLRDSYTLARLAVVLLLLGSIILPLMIHERVPIAGMFYVTTMFVGTLFFRHSVGKVSTRQLAALMGALCATVLLGIELNYVVFKKADIGEQFTYIAVALPWLSAYIIFSSLYLLRRRRTLPLLVWFGTISYSVYLLHPAVLTVMHHFCSSAFLAFCLTLASTLLLAQGSYVFVESPCVAMGRAASQRVEGLMGRNRIEADAST